MLPKIETTVHQAVLLAQKGIPVFPCQDDKKPACPHGFKDASIDPDAVKKLWDLYPGVLIGVPTGNRSGLDVLDVDPRHGGDKWLEENLYRLPITRTHKTRSGGWHLFFKHHEGLRNSAGKIAPGVDVRADGGYVIWWPALGFPVLDGVSHAE